MAYEKSVTLLSGAVGEYHRVTSFRWDRVAKELQVQISLYLDATTAADPSAEPLVREFARYRCTGINWESIIASTVLAVQAGAPDKDILALVYVAIQFICNDFHTTGVLDPLNYVVCDYGKDFYWDATPV